MFRLRSAFITLAAAFLLSGCAFVDSSISPRVGAINSGYDQAINDTILTNILRASSDRPLTFVALSKVSGSQTFSSTNVLPTFDLLAAPKQLLFGPNTLNNQATGNFDVGPLSTDRDFIKGLLDDVSLPEVDLLIKQGISRDLVFSLIIDGFEYTDSISRRRRYISNDPTNFENYCAFRGLMHGLLAYGFTTESRLHKSKLYDKDDKSSTFPRIVAEGKFCFDPTLKPPVLKEDVSANWHCGRWSAEDPVPQTKPTIKYPTISPKRDANIQEKGEVTKYSIFGSNVSKTELLGLASIDRALAAEAAKVRRDGIPPPCLDHLRSLRITDIEQPNARLRSIQGIFGFLGRILAEGKLSTVVVKSGPDRAYSGQDRIGGEPGLLLLVTKNGIGACFSQIRFNGELYCIPNEGSQNTKQVFSVLSQLIALKTKTGDLPVTATVRIAP